MWHCGPHPANRIPTLKSLADLARLAPGTLRLSSVQIKVKDRSEQFGQRRNGCNAPCYTRCSFVRGLVHSEFRRVLGVNINPKASRASSTYSSCIACTV